jgi:hypothetical protein
MIKWLRLEMPCTRTVCDCGELAEWLKAHAWKACVPQGTVSSNLTLSARGLILEPPTGPVTELRQNTFDYSFRKLNIVAVYDHINVEKVTYDESRSAADSSD